MPITQVIDGEEVTLYSPEEVEQINAEKSAVEAENAELKRLNKEKTDNFRKLNQMTEEEKAQFTDKELENRRIIEQLQEENEKLKTNLTEKEKNAIESDRANVIKKYVGDNEDLKAKFLEQYQFVNIAEDSKENIEKRAELTAKLAGIEIPESFDPTQAYWNGDAPRPLAGDNPQAFLESDRAKQALDAMGGTQ